MSKKENIGVMELSVISSDISNLDKERMRLQKEISDFQLKKEEREAEIILELAGSEKEFNTMPDSIRGAIQIKAFREDKRWIELTKGIKQDTSDFNQLGVKMNSLFRKYDEQKMAIQKENMREVIREETRDFRDTDK